MNQDIKAKWVAALRSGEYQQGDDKLKNHVDNTYCCLGVLCDLHSKLTGLGHWDDNGHYRDRLDGNDLYLTTGVRLWAELDEHHPRVDGDGLGTLNDNGYTFAQIADLIEVHL